MDKGWYLVAYERELRGDLTPASVGDVPLVIVAVPGGVRVVDAACPHRGAHLGYGGRLDRGAIICPFHGKRVRLGEDPRAAYRVQEHPVLAYGGMIFVGLGGGDDRGLGRLLAGLADSHILIPGFSRDVAVRADLVVENGFDASHFQPVHRVGNDPAFQALSSEHGEFAVSGMFELPRSRWQRGEGDTVSIPFVARAVSPYVVISWMGGDHPYVVLTGATPKRDGGCTVRVSLAVPNEVHARLPETSQRELYTYLLERFLVGIEEDASIWEHLIDGGRDGPAARYDRQDAAVVAFREFRGKFEPPAGERR